MRDRGDVAVMMIEIVIFWATTAMAPQAPVEPLASEVRAAANPAIIEDAYNAFVAVEESPNLREIVKPAIVTKMGRERVIVGAPGAAPIS